MLPLPLQYGIYSLQGDNEFFDTPEDLVRYYQKFAQLPRGGFLPEHGQIVDTVLHRPKDVGLRVVRDSNSPSIMSTESLHGTF